MQFKTKARAVDLLGKGQIADLPTAITELWKNGYDAYADKVSARIYLKGYKGSPYDLFMLTDDGIGMSRADINDKWLVLGTDSKSRRQKKDVTGIETLWKEPRIKAGEKGIGRLSVAYLGNPMLMLTKKLGQPLQVLYFDWRLLENYNLFLDDILIPVENVASTNSFLDKFEKLKNDFLTNFDKKFDDKGNSIWEDQIELRDEIITSTKQLDLPEFIPNEILEDIISIRDHHGTKFIIFNPEDQISDLASMNLERSNENAEDQNNVFNSLVGFVNSFKIKENRANKFDHSFLLFRKGLQKNEGVNLLERINFFTKDDFVFADIIIDGEIDSRTGFAGTLKLYEDDPFSIEIENSRRIEQRSSYGRIKLKVGYTLGKPDESKLDPDTHSIISKRLAKYGGIYLYRDGFRVLPYGKPEFDFLEFEQRRSKRAGSYFFSYRRMYGYIEISREENSKLKDKASREGLINNAPYRAFVQDLINVFVSLATDYFQTEPINSVFKDKKEQRKEQSEALDKDKKRKTKEKKAFTKALKEYPKKFEDYREKYEKSLQNLQSKINDRNIIYSEIADTLEEIRRLELSYKSLLPQIPQHFELTERQHELLSAYEDQILEFNNEIRNKSKGLLEDAQQHLELGELIKEFEKDAVQYISNIEQIGIEANENLKRFSENLKAEANQRILSAKKELESYKSQIINKLNSKEDLKKAQQELTKKFIKNAKELDETILPLVNHIGRLTFEIDEEKLQGAYAEQYEAIKEKWEQTRETALLGIAVEIIDHEFNALYSQIDILIKRLEKQFEEKSFLSLRRAFKQLEHKYSLLSPLYRISGSISKDVLGKNLFSYINDFFQKKLNEEGIEINASDSFLACKVFIKEPIIHTAFINIVNNAIFWLRNKEQKRILIDYFPETKEILIMNSGEKIPDYRLESIFDLFYSRRPNGRGIGLFLVRENLKENFFNVYATNDESYNKMQGACFVIKPLT